MPPPTARTPLAALLAALVLPASATITQVWNLGANGNSTIEMEHESDADGVFHQAAGDYTGVNTGYNIATSAYDLPGGIAAAVEPLKDSTGVFGDVGYVAGNPNIGLSRAWLDGIDRALNVYFQMDAAQAAAGNRYRLVVDHLGSDGAQAIQLQFALNGQIVGQASHHANRTHVVDFLGPAQVGGNVLSVVKTGGPGAWGTLDFLRLQIIDPNTIVSIGTPDNSQSEFEQENNALNDPDFYYHPGDYTAVTGTTGPGTVASEAEGWTDNASATGGFPRALVMTRPTHNIFFQMTAQQAAMPQLRYVTRLITLGAGSVHNLEFQMNGVTFHTLTGVAAATPVDVTFPTALVNGVAGGNVLSVIRTGGGTGASEWIQFDSVELLQVPEPSSFALLALGALLLRRRTTGKA
jgi:hypothetical protein